MLRRGYSYSLGVTNSGNWIWGYCCLLPTRSGKRLPDSKKRLNGEALEEYVKPIGGGYFFALPE
ncbi:hypothetical protein ACVXHA_22700 [Escherichia coli]